MARYGSRGRLWNFGLSDEGKLSATERQHGTLRALTGIDHRNRGLTVDEADRLIEKAQKEREKATEDLTDMAEKLLAPIFNQAVEAANAAGDQWIADNPTIKFHIADPDTKTELPIYGEIGRAWITWPKPSSPFYKWLVKNMNDGQKSEVLIPHRHVRRMEGELQLACMRAAYTVFRNSGNSLGDMRLMYRSEDKRHQAA